VPARQFQQRALHLGSGLPRSGFLGPRKLRSRLFRGAEGARQAGILGSRARAPSAPTTHEAIIKGFNDLNNGITVEGIYVDLTNGLEKVNTSFAGGMLPDVIYAQDSWKSAMVAQNMVVQLDDRFNAWDEKDQFSESALVRDRTDMDMQAACFFISPAPTNITGIWYRKETFFKERASRPPQPGTTSSRR
jgi:ABC-type glycerol-3-phosphate transport system substrate-binding protein